MKTKCSKCGKVLNVPDSAAGRKLKCPACASEIDLTKAGKFFEEEAQTAVKRSAEGAYRTRMIILGVILLSVGAIALLSTIVTTIVVVDRKSGGENLSLMTVAGIQFWSKIVFLLLLDVGCVLMGFCALQLQNWVNWVAAMLMAVSGLVSLWILGHGGAVIMLVAAAILALAVSNIRAHGRIRG